MSPTFAHKSPLILLLLCSKSTQVNVKLSCRVECTVSLGNPLSRGIALVPFLRDGQPTHRT